MKLSMQIFADCLKEYHPQADIKSNLFEIETIRLLSSDVSIHQNTLYVGRLRDLFENNDPGIICTHHNDILILDTADMESVLNTLLNTLSFYHAWDNAMLNLLTSEAMLQDLFDEAEVILNRPMFLVDTGQRLLAYTQSYQSISIDDVWTSMMENGSAPIDFLIQYNQQAPESMTTPGLFSYSREFFPTPSYQYGFFHQGNFLGSASIIAYDTPLTSAELDCFSMFCSYVERWFQIHIQEQQSLLLDYQFRTAILNKDADTSELCRRLVLKGWDSTDSLLLIKLDAPFQPFSINTHLSRTLNAILPDVVAVTTELSGCMLCNLSRVSLKTILRTLIPLLQSSHYYATIGEPFLMTGSWYEQYRFLKTTSSLVSKKSGKIYEGRQFALPFLLSEMQQTILTDILHPAVSLLKSYDASHNTDFYTTLYVYVKNGRSFIDTVNELHLHRNTLVYRLKRIQEIIQCDLDDSLSRLHLWLSFEIDQAPNTV